MTIFDYDRFINVKKQIDNPTVETDQNTSSDDKEVVVATGPVTLVNPEAVVDTEEFQNQLKSDFAALDTDGSAVVTADEITWVIKSHVTLNLFVLSTYMLNKKDYEMGSKSNDDFTVAMVSPIA